MLKHLCVTPGMTKTIASTRLENPRSYLTVHNATSTANRSYSQNEQLTPPRHLLLGFRTLYCETGLASCVGIINCILPHCSSESLFDIPGFTPSFSIVGNKTFPSC